METTSQARVYFTLNNYIKLNALLQELEKDIKTPINISLLKLDVEIIKKALSTVEIETNGQKAAAITLNDTTISQKVNQVPQVVGGKGGADNTKKRQPANKNRISPPRLFKQF